MCRVDDTKMNQPNEQEQAGPADDRGAGRGPATSYRLTRAARMSGSGVFKAVFDANVKRHAGPLTFFARPNGTDQVRLGLSVSRRVGGAVVRNRIKRMLREAFRLNQPYGAAGYDLVVVVRGHRPMRLEEYRASMDAALRWLDQAWKKRGTGRIDS